MHRRLLKDFAIRKCQIALQVLSSIVEPSVVVEWMYTQSKEIHLDFVDCGGRWEEEGLGFAIDSYNEKLKGIVVLSCFVVLLLPTPL